ncbi:MAG: hypothetical protein FJ276_23165 [Planctomycetes bacterium]|nr:hypothetical protein [Planctomycetota bacterium]
MASQNQGLHIALILLIMLTVGLCVTSYVMYSKAATRLSEAEDAKSKLVTAENERNAALFRAQTLTYMLEGGAKTWAQVEEDLANIPGGGAADPTMDQIRKTYQDNMMLYGPADQEHESTRNYQSLPTFLLSRIRDLNQQLTDLRRSENQLTAEKNQLEAAAADRTKKFEEGEQQARNDLAAERDKFRQDREDMQKQKDAIAAQLTDKDNSIVDLQAKFDDQQKKLNKAVSDLAQIVDDQKIQLRNLRKESFEVADATITSVNQKEGVLYVDIGSADNLKQQQTFSVYDKGTTGVMEAKSKGRVEVVRILGEHVAMCRILEDDITNIIVPGDLVFTPAWAPGRVIHFAVAGFVDVTGDGRPDMELLENLIRINGGQLAPEVTVQTRYLIQGEDRGEGIDGEPTGEERADFTSKIRMAEQIGVDRLSVDKLLTLMGWRADVRALTLGRGVGEAAEVVPEKQSPFGEKTSPEGTDSPF